MEGRASRLVAGLGDDAASQAFLSEVRRGLGEGTAGKVELQHLKMRAANTAGLAHLPRDADILAALGPEEAERFRPLLRTKPTRSQSGVAVVAVMSSPAACPHGTCIFCPGGPASGVPQSYTGFEPSTMRAIQHAYDPYRIVRSRLAQLERNGHAVDKVEVVFQGGTFPAREPAYQDWSSAVVYAALNDGPGEGTWEAEPTWTALSPGERATRLGALMAANETARCRAIGFTVETKPDWCFEEHVDRMLAHGVTRVEVGLQCLDDEVLRFTHRGHTLQDGRDALRIARDAGLKVCVHMMPGLPRKRRPSGPGWDTDAEADVEDFRRLFAEPEWRPDMLKIYPTLVVEEGETGLKAMWRRGEYAPLTTQEAAAVVARAKAHVPEWCRIQRVDRDIPTTHVLAGVMQSNLRQLVEAEQRRLGLPACRCIRCREAGRRSGAPAETLELHRTEFAAGGGTECFLSLEDPDRNALVGYLRLRRVGPDAHRPETRVPGGAAIARELKVHGTSLAVGAEGGATGAFQHRGHGSRLLWEAERIAFEEWGCGRLLVIAGPGVKPYYRKRHYHDVGPYVGRDGA